MIEYWRGVLHYLAGFDNNNNEGEGCLFNLILSNGVKSQQRDKNVKYYDHMMPEILHKMIRSVNIHYNDEYITGFSFLDKDGVLLWKIGMTYPGVKTAETVVLEDNEVIVGVVAKLLKGCQSVYTDF